MTYARARLWLGVSAVGTFVVLAIAALALGFPRSFLAGFSPSLVGDAAGLARVLALYVVVSLPFDVMGGFVLQRKFGRSTSTFFAYLASGCAALRCRPS